MKQASPVHFVAGLFQPIAPNPQRMRRQTQRCGILGVPHAAPIHRFDMHAPERLKSHRTAVGPHAVAIAPRPLGRVRLPVLRLPSRLFPAQFLQIFRTLVQIVRAQQMTRPPHQTCRRKIVFPAVVFRVQFASIPGRNMVRPEWVVGVYPGTTRCHRRFSQCSRRTREPEMEREQNIRKMCSIRTLTDARLGRQDKAGFPATGTSFLSVCLHIVLDLALAFRRDQ
jgi:hypothetical protein